MDRWLWLILVLVLATGCAPASVGNTAGDSAAVVADDLVPVATPRVVIPAERAADYVRKVMLVRLDPAYCTYEPEVSGSPTFCNDQPYPNHTFTMVVWDQDWSYLDGKCIVVEGEIEIYEGRPEIIAESLDQVYECP